MSTISFTIIYLCVAVAVAGHVFYYGVLRAPAESIFTLADHAILTLTSVATGLLWLLFVPVLLVLAFGRYAPRLRSPSRRTSFAPPHAARAGS